MAKPAKARASAPFQPTFDDVHKDIERYLTSIGKREKTADGFVKFTGYEAGQAKIVALYFEAEAFAALVNYFRKWNFEQTYNSFLFELTERLVARRDWLAVQRLWDGVLAKRRGHYNSAWKITRRDPMALPSGTLPSIRDLLIDTIERIIALAAACGHKASAAPYEAMRKRVVKGGKA